MKLLHIFKYSVSFLYSMINICSTDMNGFLEYLSLNLIDHIFMEILLSNIHLALKLEWKICQTQQMTILNIDHLFLRQQIIAKKAIFSFYSNIEKDGQNMLQIAWLRFSTLASMTCLESFSSTYTLWMVQQLPMLATWTGSVPT